MRPDVDGTETSWRGVADELASALRAMMLRNPAVTTRDWNQAQAALGRYELAGDDQRPAQES